MIGKSVTIALQTDKPLAAYGPLAAMIETAGFAGVTVYNDLFFQPAWLPLLEIARATRRLRIGPAAVNPFTCHPINIAGQIALIDEASQGRAYLGLARGGWLDQLGIHPPRPVTALREAIECVRRLLVGSPEPYRGAVFQLSGDHRLRWDVPRPDVPILLGSWGARTIRACIDQVDEIKLGGTANPDVIPHFRHIIDEAAGPAGRDPAGVGLVVGAVTVVDLDGEAARAQARREVALYLPVVAPLDPSLEIDPEWLARLAAAAQRRDDEAAAALISDEQLRRFAFAGAPEEVAEQAQMLFQQGASRVEFGTPHGLTAEEGLRLLGERVLPALALTDNGRQSGRPRA